ncbi:MAG: hypothetical protein PHS66_02765 [Candidatus Omnitrophica bacterium]|nr:hypothetical protein [Candidatus Omnitrophota bacterium]
MVKRKICFKIGGIKFSLESQNSLSKLENIHMLKRFIVGSMSRPDIRLVIKCRDVDKKFLSLNNSQKIFDGYYWGLHQAENKKILLFSAPEIKYLPQPYHAAVFNKNFSYGEIFDRNRLGKTPEINPLLPLMGPILVSSLLYTKNAVLFHSCGVVDKGVGFIFLGHSGYGKTTTANLWIKSGAMLLNDDKVIIRKINKKFWIFGTPWFGKFRNVSPSGAPLKGIFFLKHGKANKATRVSSSQAVSLLISRSHAPLWDNCAYQKSIDLCGQIVKNIPCYELEFVPDNTAVNFVRALAAK